MLMVPLFVLIPEIVHIVIGSVRLLQIRVYLVDVSCLLSLGDSKLIHELRFTLIIQEEKVRHIFYFSLDVHRIYNLKHLKLVYDL